MNQLPAGSFSIFIVMAVSLGVTPGLAPEDESEAKHLKSCLAESFVGRNAKGGDTKARATRRGRGLSPLENALVKEAVETIAQWERDYNLETINRTASRKSGVLRISADLEKIRRKKKICVELIRHDTKISATAFLNDYGGLRAADGTGRYTVRSSSKVIHLQQWELDKRIALARRLAQQARSKLLAEGRTAPDGEVSDDEMISALVGSDHPTARYLRYALAFVLMHEQGHLDDVKGAVHSSFEYEERAYSWVIRQTTEMNGPDPIDPQLSDAITWTRRAANAYIDLRRPKKQEPTSGGG